MATNPPAGALSTTYSARFAKLYLNGVLVAGATDVRFGMHYDGTWDQPIGVDRPVNNPDKRYGTGTIQQLKWVGSRLVDIMVQAGLTTAQAAATGDADLRFMTFTLSIPYTDGTKTGTSSLFDVYIRQLEDEYNGNRLVTSNVNFEYAAQGDQ